MPTTVKTYWEIILVKLLLTVPLVSARTELTMWLLKFL